jgi:putative oxidoreductase
MVRESLLVTGRFRPAYRRTTDALNNLGWLPNLVLRLTIGFMFFSGALSKLGDLGKFTAMFASLGIPAAQVLAPVTAVVELVGGAALMLGLGTRLVSLVRAGTIVGVIHTLLNASSCRTVPCVRRGGICVWLMSDTARSSCRTPGGRTCTLVLCGLGEYVAQFFSSIYSPNTLSTYAEQGGPVKAWCIPSYGKTLRSLGSIPQCYNRSPEPPTSRLRHIRSGHR